MSCSQFCFSMIEFVHDLALFLITSTWALRHTIRESRFVVEETKRFWHTLVPKKKQKATRALNQRKLRDRKKAGKSSHCNKMKMAK